jgi:hypothetical protein
MSTTSVGRRTWTDEELQAAVSAQHSWRGVLRALGLKSTSGVSLRTIRQRADDLGLDSSHFTGQRKWTDAQLRRAVADGSSWSEVIHLLRMFDNGENRVRIKGHAVRLGLDVSHLAPSAKEELPAEVMDVPPDLTRLRAAAPSIAMVWFGLRGWAVALPIEPQEYDLLVTMPSGIQRVQVKSTTSHSERNGWQVGVGRRPYTLDKTAGKAPYDPETIDLFFIVDGLGHIYLIPASVLGGRTAITLDSYASYLVGDASSLLV